MTRPTARAHATGRRVVRRRRRRTTALAAVVLVVTGLLVHAAGRGVDGATGLVADAVGDALFAVLVTVLLAWCAPAARSWPLAGVALAACAGIEVAQLTGVPAALAERWWPVRYVLGTTFHAPDLPAYAVGAAAAGGGMWRTSHAARLTALRRPPMDGSERGTTRARTHPRSPRT